MTAQAISRRQVFHLARAVALVLISVWSLIPIAWMVSMALKPANEWVPLPGELTWFPKHPTLENFTFIFTGTGSGSNITFELQKTATWPIFASILTSCLGTGLAVVSGTLAAYSTSRLGRGAFLASPLLQMRLIPPLAVMIPVMVMWTFLDLTDTWYGLSLLYGIVTLPFSYWLMLTFFDDIPHEIEQAARLEGCSEGRIFWRVVLPMAKPGLAATALFVFILNWSDYAIALLLTTKNWLTIPVYMDQLANGGTGQMYGAKAALGLIAILPPMVFGIFIQKHLVRGLTFGALKQ